MELIKNKKKSQINNNTNNVTDEYKWQAKSIPQIIDILHTNDDVGLSSNEIQEREQKYGLNRLQERHRESFFEEFFEELTEPLILLLIIVGVTYFILKDFVDGIVIFVIILILTSIEVINESRATKAISELQNLAEPDTLVVRDGFPTKISVENIFPGDVVILDAGHRVPADIRLTECYGLLIDESTLTGESIPVLKDNTISSTDIPLAEQKNMAFSGTLVTSGRGKGIIVSTGMKTKLGEIVGLTNLIEESKTPLQKTMNDLSKYLLFVALFFSALIPVLGILIAKQSIVNMVLVGLSLIFATVPEELPIIVTMVLALGAYHLSKQHVIVKKLKSVETLGCVNILATDKTGTLTKNQLGVSEIYPEFNQDSILLAASIANNTLISEGKSIGDPLDIALIQAAKENKIDENIINKYPKFNEYSFDNIRKRMSVITQDANGNYSIWSKGAPESILSCCSQYQSKSGIVDFNTSLSTEIGNKVDQMAKNGQRIIALATKQINSEGITQNDAEQNMIFLGIVGLSDPPREGVDNSLEIIKNAGIKSIIITGDHPLTTQRLAKEINFEGSSKIIEGKELEHLNDDQLKQIVLENTIFARTTPGDKLKIVNTYKSMGQYIAVTGDGVNDSPALVSADIGIAFADTGSDVAKEAADMVLTDDNYLNITNAIYEGRNLFNNLHKAVRYYLTIKIALILVMFLPILLNIKPPFTPIQIIILELFMDLAASAAFVAEPAESEVMRQKPRDPKKPFMDKKLISEILVNAVILFAIVSFNYLLTWYQTKNYNLADTAAFVSWLIGHVLLALNMRTDKQPLFKIGILTNKIMVAWAAVTFIFVLVITSFPVFITLLKVQSLAISQWLLILITTIAGTFWIELLKTIKSKSVMNI